MILRVLVLLAICPVIATADAIDFERQIQPILTEHCAKCHGEEKAQGKMRLDNLAGIEAKLAAEPQLLVAGRPDESELYQRLVLPPDNPKRMPKGADPLSQKQIDLIGEWITQGAKLSAATTTAPDSAAEEKHEAKPAEKPALPTVAAAPEAAIERLTAAGARVTPLYAGSNLLEVSFTGGSEPAGDDDVALLADVADQVYSLNLVGANVTGGGLAPLAGLKNLAWLHLERTNLADDGLAHLAGLEQLQYLNLYGTSITDAGLKNLANLKDLSRLYLWQTKVSYDAAMALERDTPGLLVNLGFDHPEVIKRRLMAELEQAKQQAEAAKVETAKAQEQLKRAEDAAAAAAARATEIEKKIHDLAAPSNGS